MKTTISTFPKTLLAHRLLLIFAPISVYIVYCISAYVLKLNEGDLNVIVLLIALFVPAALLIFQYVHQAYLAFVHRAVFPAVFFVLNTLLLTVYTFSWPFHSWPMLSGDAILLAHGLVIIGYFVHHNASPLEGPANSTLDATPALDGDVTP